MKFCSVLLNIKKPIIKSININIDEYNNPSILFKPFPKYAYLKDSNIWVKGFMFIKFNKLLFTELKG